MKKSFGVLFILLATLVILAHAFVPHHHHDRIVVSFFGPSFIEKIFEQVHHHHHKHLHSHDHSQDHTPVNPDHEDKYSEDCLLDDLYRRLNQTRKHQLTGDDDSKSSNFDHVPFFVAAPVQQIEIKDYGEFPFRQNPYLPASFLTLIGCSLSFRGPPVC